MNTTELESTEGIAAFCEGLALRHFSPCELLCKGEAHVTKGHRGYQLNSDPPPDLWPNIIPALTVLDRLREASGGPVTLLSAYRGKAYNAVIGGASKSQHMEFSAIDFQSKVWSPRQCFDWLKRDRALGGFSGGLGSYNTFTHIDGRGVNATWDNS